MTSGKTNEPLGVLTVGMGSVASTLFAGVESARRGIHHPIGSITQTNSFPGNSSSSETLSNQLGLVKLEAICF
ncbi:MAG: hypothetical protein KJT03_01520, partial [Verrucomicrobiae bacterium]|nr:hypothetical protein [Verrucomicrobiae bacterium]